MVILCTIGTSCTITADSAALATSVPADSASQTSQQQQQQQLAPPPPPPPQHQQLQHPPPQVRPQPLLLLESNPSKLRI